MSFRQTTYSNISLSLAEFVLQNVDASKVTIQLEGDADVGVFTGHHWDGTHYYADREGFWSSVVGVIVI